jgi:Raf kinase inhibitor-like YbhB/YbcL family protein
VLQRHEVIAGSIALLLATAACKDTPPPNANATTGTFTLTSGAYAEGAMIPAKNKCTKNGGENKSPPLAWTGAPAGAASFAMVMRDLDHRPDGKPNVHWVIWDIPSSAKSLPEGVEPTANPANVPGAKQAVFRDNIVGYYGPCPPDSVHTYEITLYAMPAATIASITTATGKNQAAEAIEAAKVASTKYVGKSEH